MTEVGDDDVRRFSTAIELRLGLRVAERRGAMVEIIARRAAGHHESIAAYLRRVDSAEPDELRALVPEVSVGETYFFRHVEQFHAYAELIAVRSASRVLSAGCSSGEEAYTLAILARDRAPDPRAVTINAIDFNPAALERAERARYSRWALRATPTAQETHWFEHDGRDLILAPEIRDAVTFSEANLLADGAWMRPPYDIIFCRNVIMYFDETRNREVVARLVRALVPGGHLFLGHAETLRDNAHGLELCHTHGTFYYRRARGSRSPTAPPSGSSGSGDPRAHVDDVAWIGDIAAATERVNALVDGALGAVPVALPAIAPPMDVLASIRTMLVEERFAEAVAALAALPPAVGHGADAVLLRAIAATQTGDVVAAKATCAALLALEPRAASAHYLLAICHAGAGESASSELHAREAITLDPTFTMASVQLAFLARRAGDSTRAVEHLVRAISLLEHEDPQRLALFGGGFSRAALHELCRAELAAIRGPS